jgi:aminoglycoside phosphotransferase (APT) family kinase protein
MTPGTPLTGGRSTAGVVRIGDEVRRPVGEHSEFVHAVLRELEAAGFPGAPRFLGVDEQGRERLSYLQGWVAPDLAHGEWTDEQLVATAERTRAFHDVLGGSPLAGGEETVCHNDLGPCNTVQSNGVPVAFIDWDAASPGPRALDLARSAWYWTVTSEVDVLPLDEQVRRVRLMADAYRLVPSRRSMADAILAEQQRTIANIAAALKRGDPNTDYWQSALEWHRAERAWFAAHQQAFKRGLR